MKPDIILGVWERLSRPTQSGREISPHIQHQTILLIRAKRSAVCRGELRGPREAPRAEGSTTVQGKHRGPGEHHGPREAPRSGGMARWKQATPGPSRCLVCPPPNSVRSNNTDRSSGAVLFGVLGLVRAGAAGSGGTSARPRRSAALTNTSRHNPPLLLCFHILHSSAPHGRDAPPNWVTLATCRQVVCCTASPPCSKQPCTAAIYCWVAVLLH